MAAALVVPCSGPYISTWSAQSLGVLNDDGFAMRCTVHGQEVSATDQYGKTLVQGVYQGQDWRCRLTGLEWTNGLLSALQAFGQVVQTEQLAPTLSGLITTVNVGDTWTNYWKPLILTAILSDPPTSPQSLTAANAIIAPEMQSDFNMTSAVRTLPLDFCLIPYRQTGGSANNLVVPFSTL